MTKSEAKRSVEQKKRSKICLNKTLYNLENVVHCKQIIPKMGLLDLPFTNKTQTKRFPFRIPSRRNFCGSRGTTSAGLNLTLGRLRTLVQLLQLHLPPLPWELPSHCEGFKHCCVSRSFRKTRAMEKKHVETGSFENSGDLLGYLGRCLCGQGCSLYIQTGRYHLGTEKQTCPSSLSSNSDILIIMYCNWVNLTRSTCQLVFFWNQGPLLHQSRHNAQHLLPPATSCHLKKEAMEHRWGVQGKP